MLTELWDAAGSTEERCKRVSSKIADWFAEYESKGEILVRIFTGTDEFSALCLAMKDEFVTCLSEELLEQGKKGHGAIKIGVLWTAEVFVIRADMSWVELLGNKGTKMQKV